MEAVESVAVEISKNECVDAEISTKIIGKSVVVKIYATDWWG